MIGVGELAAVVGALAAYANVKSMRTKKEREGRTRAGQFLKAIAQNLEVLRERVATVRGHLAIDDEAGPAYWNSWLGTSSACSELAATLRTYKDIVRPHLAKREFNTLVAALDGQASAAPGIFTGAVLDVILGRRDLPNEVEMKPPKPKDALRHNLLEDCDTCMEMLNAARADVLAAMQKLEFGGP